MISTADQKKIRNRPMAVDFHGMTLHISPIYKDNILNQLSVSYRFSKEEFGLLFSKSKAPKLFKKVYRPVSDTPISKGAALPEGVIWSTLEKVIPTLFLPQFFELYPKLLNTGRSVGLLAPYGLAFLTQREGWSPTTCREKQKALEAIISCWGSLPLDEMTPSRCGPTLMEIEVGRSKDVVALVRQLVLILAPNSNIVNDWANYRIYRKVPYSTVRTAQKRILTQPLAEKEIFQVLELCKRNYLADSRYLLSMIMILSGISPEEACALTPKDFQQQKGYGSYALSIRGCVDALGARKNGDGHIRGHRHEIKAYKESPNLRVLGLSPYLASKLNRYIKARDSPKNDVPFLRNPNNLNRLLDPRQFAQWIDATFSHLISSPTMVLGEKKVTSNQSLARRFAVTARFMLEHQAPGCSEGISHYFSQSPKTTLGISYAKFDAPSYTTKMGRKQQEALVQIFQHNRNST